MDFERERRDSALFMSQSCKNLQSSPSLTTLDFDMSVGEYDDPNDLDMRSIGDEQTAGEGSFPRKYRTHTLRTLLRSPGEENRANRLRKRGNTNRNDDVEAGFENNNRRHSRISVQSPDSRNSPNKTQHRLSYTN